MWEDCDSEVRRRHSGAVDTKHGCYRKAAEKLSRLVKGCGTAVTQRGALLCKPHAEWGNNASSCNAIPAL